MLINQKDKFSIPSSSHYLNCAYMSPLLKSVEEVGKQAIEDKRDPSQIRPQDFFTNCTSLRAEFAKLINTDDPNSIAIIPSASYGLANAANNIPLRSGDEIIVLEEQFPSNYYIWKERCNEVGAKLVTIEAPKGEDRVSKWNEQIILAINDKTRVVAMGQVHWTDGSLFDLKSISERIHSNEGYLVIDGTQSVGAFPFDVDVIAPDVLICAGYKWLLGPYGIGFGYYNERFEAGKPIEYSWITRRNSEDFAGLVKYQDEYQPGAQRYDAGERSSFVNVSMQLRALEQINEWGAHEIQNFCAELIEPAVNQLQGMGFQIENDKDRGSHLFGVRFDPKYDPKRIAESLSQNRVNVSVRGSAVRVAPHVYNTANDLEVLVESLKNAV